MPFEEVGGPIVQSAAPDGHDAVGAGNRPATAALLEAIGNDVFAAALDDSGANGQPATSVFVVTHPMQVRPAVPYELRDRFETIRERRKLGDHRRQLKMKH